MRIDGTRCRHFRAAFTLLEVLTALTITLILMGLVMEMFSKVSEGINNSRANMEMSDQLRHAKHRLILDLRGATAPTIPPLDPKMDLGYFEYVEGPRVATSQFARDSFGGDAGEILTGGWNSPPTVSTGSTTITVNSMVGDNDDILMFTTCSYDDKFVGLAGKNRNGVPIAGKSRHAEVAWFLRRQPQDHRISMRNDGRAELYTLHRRQFIVAPNGGGRTTLDYTTVDYSLRPVGGDIDNNRYPSNAANGRRNTVIVDNRSLPWLDVPGRTALDPGSVRNSLGDLTKRECRSLHQPYIWPYEMVYTGQFNSQVDGHLSRTPNNWTVPISMLSLNTLAEQTNGAFPLPQPQAPDPSKPGYFKLKTTSTLPAPSGFNPGVIGNQTFGAGNRIGSDIILTNVLGFDVKAWDPGAPIFSAPDPRAPSMSAGVVVPGDAGYVPILRSFVGNPASPALQPIAFGAFADLNYMGWDTNSRSNTKNPTWLFSAYQGRPPSGQNALTRLEASKFANRCKLPRAQFAHPGDATPNLQPHPLSGYPTGQWARPAVWDTWSTHYEYDGISNDGDAHIDEFTNGIDDNGNGLVDEPNFDAAASLAVQGEQDAPPPYMSPLRGIKVIIRVMEPDSKEVRQVTLVHEFLPL